MKTVSWSSALGFACLGVAWVGCTATEDLGSRPTAEVPDASDAAEGGTEASSFGGPNPSQTEAGATAFVDGGMDATVRADSASDLDAARPIPRFDAASAQDVPNDCAGGDGSQAGSPWSMLGHCPAHQNRASIAGPASTPAQKWSSGAATKPAQPAIAADGTLYVANTGNLWAIHSDGTPAWNYHLPYGEMPVYPNPTIGRDGTVYVGAPGAFLAISPNGTFKWKIPLPTGSFGAEVGSDAVIDPAGTIYFYSSDGVVHAVDPGGTEKWTLALPPAGLVILAPSLGADGVLHISDGHTVYAVDTRGELGWTATFEGHAYAPVVGTNGLVYITESGSTTSDNGSWLHAYHANGTRAWSYSVSAGIGTTMPAIGADGTAYFAGNDGLVYAIDPSGAKKWTAPLSDAPQHGIIVGGDGTIYVATKAAVVAIDSAGAQRWSFPIAEPTRLALAADGSLLVSAAQLVALR